MVATTRLGLNAQTPGTNANTWGNTLNTQGLDLIDEAIAGVEPIAVAGNMTLSSTNFVANQARNAVLMLTAGGLTGAATITIPSREKLYLVNNGTGRDITFSAGGAVATLATGRWAFIVCNGTDVFAFDPVGLTEDARAAAILAAGNAASSATTAGNRAGYAQEWANKPENVPVSPAAGGDGFTTFSAKHYAVKFGKVPAFETRAALQASIVAADAGSIAMRGFATAGDGGGATYRRVASQPSHAGKVQSSDGTWWELAEPIIRPEMVGAIGNGVADDTAAIASALLIPGRVVRGTPGRDYVVGDLALPDACAADFAGCRIRRKPGASHALIVGSFHGRLSNADVLGSFDHQKTTFSGPASAGATVVSVANASGIKAGMLVVYPSAWTRGGQEINEVLSVSGSNVTLRRPLKGAVSTGARFLADFPLVRSAGLSLIRGDIENIHVRSCLFGFQTGASASAGTGSFTSITNLRASDFIGAGIIHSANTAGERIVGWSATGGRYQSVTVTGTGASQTVAYPFELSPLIHRWGTEPSVRLFFNGVQQPVSAYTANQTAGTVTFTAPVGANVTVGNFEYAAFGMVGLNIAAQAPSSLEHIAIGTALDCRVGMYFEGCELGMLTACISDGSSYAGLILKDCNDIHVRASDFLFAPFPLILDGCTNCSAVSFSTSLVPDNVEFVTTSAKREVMVLSGCTNVLVDETSWHSKTGWTADIATTALPTTSKVSLNRYGLAVNSAISGLAILRGLTGDGYFQITDDGKQGYFGGSGFQYFGATASFATMQFGSFGPGGSLDLRSGAGVRLTIDGNGSIILPGIATSAAGTASGGIYSDGGTLKIKP